MHNADTVLDKAPGQEAFSTVIIPILPHFSAVPVWIELGRYWRVLFPQIYSNGMNVFGYLAGRFSNCALTLT